MICVLWFQIFMAIMMLLIPVTMLLFGHLWKKAPPNKINSAYGYRTKRSMSSRRAWAYAHEVCGKVWRWFGTISLSMTLVLILLMLILCRTVEGAGNLGLIVVFAQMIPLVAAIPITERALKKKFEI